MVDAGALRVVQRKAFDAFTRHLELERARSPHTVAAYRSDISDLLRFVYGPDAGQGDPGELSLTALRACHSQPLPKRSRWPRSSKRKRASPKSAAVSPGSLSTASNKA